MPLAYPEDEVEEKAIKEARIKAERAVSDMKDKDLRDKAFEVILNHLLQEADGSQRELSEPNKIKKAKQAKQPDSLDARQPTTLPDRILLMKEESFFGSQRTIREIKESLAAHGWHYPNTALSGALQSLTQRRALRRLRAPEGKKMVWKYSNP